MRFVVQMEDMINDDGNIEVVNVFECFGEYNNLHDAKVAAQKLIEDIKYHKCQYTKEISHPYNWIGVVISKYYSDSKRVGLPNMDKPNRLVDVIEIEDIPPEVWN